MMVFASVFVACRTDDSDAASAGVSDVSIRVFDQDSSNYSALAYLSNKLPNTLSAAEWMMDTDGYWYNVNSTSPSYGSILTYGITGLTDDVVRSDVVAAFPIFTADFVILQVQYKLNYACNVSVEIDEGGLSVYTNSSSVPADVAGCHMNNGMTRAKVLSVKDAGADINVTDVRGTYSVSFSYNGISVTGASVDYLGAKIVLGGNLTDYDDKPVSGATVTYAYGTEYGTVITDAAGDYRIYADAGSAVTVTGISIGGYTFTDGIPYAYGEQTENVLPGPTFKAPERTVIVTISDGSGIPVSGVSIDAIWYTCVGTGPYDITKSVEGIRTRASNDAGKALVTVPYDIAASKTTEGAKLWIAGKDSKYNFERDTMPEGAGSPNPIPVSLSKAGNVYANTSTFADTSITTIEKSFEVTIAGALDGSLAGGSPLTNAQVSAVWYYQAEDVGDYIISVFEDIEAGSFIDLTADTKGTVRMDNTYSDADGKVKIVYKEPVWTVSPGEKAFLYVYVSGTNPYSTAADYHYTVANIHDGSDPLDVLVASAAACDAGEKGSIVDMTIRSDEVAYTVTGTITGVLPESVTAYCYSPSLKADSKPAYPSVGTITFTFPVKAGTSNTVGVDDVAGYSFSVQSKVLPSASADQTFESVASRSVPPVDRSETVIISTYTVNGTSAGDAVTIGYTVADASVSITSVAVGDPLIFNAYGRAGNITEGTTITGVGGVYVSPLSGNTATAYKIGATKIVTYINAEGNTPTVDNISAGVTIQCYCGGSQYTSITTDATGIVTVSLPDPSVLSFKMGEYSLVGVPMTSGPFAGFVAINLSGVVEPAAPTEVSFTIRYIASSSMQNVETPTNIDVLDSPVTTTCIIGSVQTYRAPDLNGFKFSGWFMDGKMVSDAKDNRLCTITITDNMDGMTLVASYSAENPPQPEPDYGTEIAIGILAVTLSIIALIFVFLQMRRYSY